ncbi:MAG: FAD-binding oxidoreductase, partial [Mesorhizobium sp.]
MSEQTEVIIIGGGMTGAGAAYEISRDRKVVLFERESHCGCHTTGRSA